MADGIVGTLEPPIGIALKPLGDGNLKLIPMIVGPVVFCTIVGTLVLGIAHLRDPPRVGRVGLKAHRGR